MLTPSPQGPPGARYLPHTESSLLRATSRGCGSPIVLPTTPPCPTTVSTGQPVLGTTTGRMWHLGTATEQASHLRDSPNAQRAGHPLPPSHPAQTSVTTDRAGAALGCRAALKTGKNTHLVVSWTYWGQREEERQRKIMQKGYGEKKQVKEVSLQRKTTEM